MNIAAVYFWPLVQGMAWWNMVAACNDFTDNASNTINCLWGAITSAITIAGVGVKTAIWVGGVTNTYFSGKRDLAQLQGHLNDLEKIIGHNVSYLGMWDHSNLGLNYSDPAVAMENKDPLHVFGITAPDGTQSHFTYIGNSTGKHVLKLGLGSGVSNTTTSNSTISGRQTLTIGAQVRLISKQIAISLYVSSGAPSYLET
jgi:hypothetical protein